MRRLTLADVDLLNEIIARDWPESGADLTQILANPLNVCLLCGRSGTIFAWRGPGVYEAHIAYDVRGREALAIIDKAQRYMLDNFMIRMFWALIPENDRKVRLFARWAGWKSEGLLRTDLGEQELFVREFA